METAGLTGSEGHILAPAQFGQNFHRPHHHKLSTDISETRVSTQSIWGRSPDGTCIGGEAAVLQV